MKKILISIVITAIALSVNSEVELSLKTVKGYSVPQRGDSKDNNPNWADSYEKILTDLLDSFALGGKILSRGIEGPTGPQGKQGDQGTKGDQGIQGDPGPTAAWGGITGTLSNQTDLNTILNGKASSSHSHAPADITGTAVITTDNRLSDARTAIDVYSWAKASTKPSYSYSEVGADASGAASTVQSNLTTHGNLTTSAHGGIVASTDSRLTDSRNAADVSAWAKAGTKPTYTYSDVGASPTGAEVAANKGAVSGYCGLNSSQKVAIANIPTGTTTNDVCIGNDSRLSDSRTPVAHNQDANTITTGTLDGDRLPAFSTTKKAGVPATGTPSGKYLKDDGTWATVSGGSTPTGTGWRHITSGVEDGAASTPSASDVSLGNVTNESKATMFTSAALTGTPTTPTAAAGTNTTQIASTAFVTAINNNGQYRTILQASASHTAAKVAGTYALGFGGVAAVGGAGTLYPLNVIQIASADYPTINGITTKLRISAQLYTNDVAPTGNYTFGLYPITRPSTSGGAGVCIYTIGTVVSGSNGATFTAPAADLLGSAVGSDFALPANGPYIIAVVTTATVATSAHVHLNAQLQMRNQ
jgi:hypothetical protein